MKRVYYVVELIDEYDELFGYAVAVVEERLKYSVLPTVYGTRSEAHVAKEKLT
jgi:hypothetical protein